MPPKAREQGKQASTDEDQFPTVTQALYKVRQAIDQDGAALRRLDLRAGAGGELYYRLWIGRDDEHLVGHVPAGE